jgi:RNA polymerase I-specific transcription initiation factor RRN5
MGPPDIPAAFEISEECCTLLETTADALTVRQERNEVETEQGKWGDSWLLTKDASREIEKRRRVEGGREALDEVLPAANMFNLEEWLQLSERVFMNPASSNEEDNWYHLVEEDETPSIRATAFEDFYSLAVHETKKLVSTTLFCTMSRVRAQNSRRSEKHGDVTQQDVESAINILKMKHSTEDFWIKSARRNHLNIIDDGSDEEGDEGSEEVPVLMTYDEVEEALKATPKRSRSQPRPRSRSHSRPPTREQTQLPSEEPDSFHSGDESPLEYDTDALSNPKESDFPTSREGTPSNVFNDAEAYAIAKDAYTETLDLTASLEEETRLYSVLKRSPPSHIKAEVLEEPIKAKQLRREVDLEGNWRGHIEFRSEWEVMDMPVSEGAFERNRNLKRKRDVNIERRNLRSRSEVHDEIDVDMEEGPPEPSHPEGGGPDDVLEKEHHTPSPVVESPFRNLARRQRRLTDVEMEGYE